MPFFSRLTDIVTCNLSDILAAAADPRAALEEVVLEMEQGVTGAQRSMKTAAANESRLRREIDEQRQESDRWVDAARRRLADDDEPEARLALLRKRELENLIAGLEMQLKAATATREHLTTILHALEARLADARRRRAALEAGSAPDAAPGRAAAEPSVRPATPTEPARATDVIEIELAALKRELRGE